jgi:cytolysin-activating lysine-acyltransferase
MGQAGTLLSPLHQSAGGAALAGAPAPAAPLPQSHGLAVALPGGDAGVAQQRKGDPMAQPADGDGNNGGKNGGSSGGTVQPPETAFTKPAPAGAAKKVSEVLGEIVWLMSQSPLHKQFFISGLEWLVMTPVLLQQFRLFYDKDKPIGVAFWGTVSEEVEQRLAAGTTRLRPQDWKSGDRLWVVEIIAPFGGAEAMVQDLKAKVFAEKQMKFLALDNTGQRSVRVV